MTIFRYLQYLIEETKKNVYFNNIMKYIYKEKTLPLNTKIGSIYKISDCDLQTS